MIINKNSSTNSFVWVDGVSLLVKGESKDEEIFVQNGGFEEWTIKSTEEQKAREGEVVENYSEFHPCNGEWQPIMVWHVLDNIPKEVRLSIVNQGGEDDFIYADDVMLTMKDQLSDKTNKDLNNIVQNGGFEEWEHISDYEHKSEIPSGFHSGGNNWEFLQVKKGLRSLKIPVYFDINVSNISQNDSIVIDDAVDDAGFVIRDIDDAAGLYDDVNRSPQCATLREPAGDKILFAKVLPVLVEDVADDLVSGRLGSVP